MSKRFSYTVVPGDTIQDLSTRFYGLPSEYPKILNANPSLAGRPNSELFVGDILSIPASEELNTQTEEQDDFTNEVIIEVDEFTIKDFWGFKLERSIDIAADSFSFTIPWDISNDFVRNTFRPFKFNDIVIKIGGILQLTGTVIAVEPDVGTDASTLKIAGYSKCGVLNDCQMPITAYPLVYEDTTFPTLAGILANPFNIKVTDLTDDDFQFEEIDIKPTDKVYGYLAKMAQKRGSLITSLPNGNLVIQKTTDQNATFSLIEGNPTILGITVNYQGQAAFTSTTGILKGQDSKDPALDDVYTETDPFMVAESDNRSEVFMVDDVEEGVLKDAVKSRLRRSWGQRISYAATLQGWRDPNGDLWVDNKRVNVQYPSAMIYNNTEFLIKKVSLSQDGEKDITHLTLVLPQTYNQDDLESLPWLQ